MATDRPSFPLADARQKSVPEALRQLYGFMSPRHRAQFYRLLGLMLLSALAELATIGAVVPFLSLLAGQQGLERVPWLAGLFDLLGAESQSRRIVAATLLFVAAALAASALRLQLAWSTQRFVLGLGHEMAVEIQRRTLLQPYSFHVGGNSSQIIAALENVQFFVTGVVLPLMQATTEIVLGLFILAAMVQVDPFAAAASTILFGLLYAAVSLLTRRRLTENSSILRFAYGERVQIIQESLGGIRDVLIDHCQGVFVEEFRRIDRRFTAARAKTIFISTAPRFVIEAVGMVIIAALAVVLSDREGGLMGALPIIGAMALGAQRLLPLMQQLYQAWANLAGHRSLVTQVLVLLHLDVEESPAGGEEEVRPLGFRDRVRIEQVSFTYPGRSRPAVADVTLDIPRGSRLALVGRTGSGKSTLADLVMGLLEPDEGRITIDGVVLGRDTRLAWQRCIAHVPQSIFLSDASIARNIAFGTRAADIDMERVIRAAEIAQLDGFVSTVPEGYETRAGERGVRLSGGQRQRLGIARAVYKQAPLLVLDEATNALDPETEASLMHALDQLGDEGRTIIVIAHSGRLIESCDMVARLERGRLVEVGGPPMPVPVSR